MKSWSTEVDDEEGTARLAYALAALLSAGDTLVLEGGLGAGKTTFTRQLLRARGLPEDEPVTSPTFALAHEYELSPLVIHADLYRLSHPDELFELGIEEAMGATAIAIVEWGERFADALPGLALYLRIAALDLDRRRFDVEAVGARGERIVEALAAGFTASR